MLHLRSDKCLAGKLKKERQVHTFARNWGRVKLLEVYCSVPGSKSSDNHRRVTM